MCVCVSRVFAVCSCLCLCVCLCLRVCWCSRKCHVLAVCVCAFAFPVFFALVFVVRRATTKVMASLGVPLTLRWEVSNKYRGLQCDGLHAMPHFSGGRAWNCGGFPAYEELILQSGLQQLCLKHQMHLCK